MARPNQEAIDTFISITGVTESIAVQKLEEHHGDLNAAVNAHFSEGDRSTVRDTSVIAPEDDLMDIDDPVEVAPRRNPMSLLTEASTMNPFSLLDPQFHSSLFNGGSDFTNRAPFVSQPRERREIPIEVKDGSDASSRSGHAPIIEDVTGTVHTHEPDIHGTVIVDDEDDIPANQPGRAAPWTEQRGDASGDGALERHAIPSVPEFNNLPDYSNDIEEEMIRAAIEASKREAEEAEQEKALRELRGKVGASEMGASKPDKMELGTVVASNGRERTGSLSIQEEAEDVEEQPLVRHRARRTSSGSVVSAREVGVIEASPPTSPGQNNLSSHPQRNGDSFSDEWGGISSEEHDEAVMLEAAMFGGIPEGTGYRFPYAPHQFMQAEGSYSRGIPRPPSPSLQAQRLIREQQDDEYLASLAADREKEMKAMEEAEARRLQEEAARKAALEEDRLKEEESRRKLEEEQEFERQLAAKEASLPQEPPSDDENAITLLVRMPNGTRCGRRFLKTDNLRSLFDFIDIARVANPGSYRLVRPYPRRAFSDGESELTLRELGLTTKQEALFLELI
ncbi:plant UBX domain-containing protein 8 [Ricinus communis]|uniref:plant UBX domain-containing protein 8 n=1 Tax=Ricinus communis TaxID=3988 RepID=UPI00077281C2|nr:plant UBX domain-containing protein 8 [Ricinus communis]|eukprot:XP_015571776.1 plant UBX domain-containing protein 8 [Ricinus communis]